MVTWHVSSDTFEWFIKNVTWVVSRDTIRVIVTDINCVSLYYDEGDKEFVRHVQLWLYFLGTGIESEHKEHNVMTKQKLT